MRWIASLGFLPAVAFAAPDTLLTQGRLLASDGSAMNGTFNLTFTLFDAPTGGTNKWSEPHTGVVVQDGFYAVVLGETQPLDEAALLGDRWLAVSVAGNELSRSPMTASAWALRAAGVTLTGEAGGANPGACTSAQVGTIRYNTDRDRLEFCRANGGAPAWAGLTFSEIAGDDNAGRTFADGTTAASCQDYLDDFRYQGPATGDGMYWITPAAGTTVKVWCDMTTESGGWLDVVKSYHGPGADAAALTDLLFSGEGTITGTAATNSAGVDGVLLYTNQPPSHQASYWLDKDVLGYTSARLSFRMQGSTNSQRCSSTNWVPLNGPGYNGGNTGYLAACPAGYSCIQGTSTIYRDAPIHVSGYATDTLSPTQILAWSGSNSDGDAVIPGCSDDPEIPSTQPILWVYQLLIR